MGYLVAYILGFLTAIKKPSKDSEGAVSPADKPNNKYSSRKLLSEIPAAPASAEYSCQRCHHKSPRWKVVLDWLTFFAALGTVAAATWYACITRDMWTEVRKQSEIASRQLEQTQRPWIVIDEAKIADNDGLIIGQSAILTTVRIGVKNIGHSPATNFEIFPMLHCCGGLGSDTVKGSCEGNGNSLEGAGETIFQERQGLPIGYPVSLSKADVIAYWKLPPGQRTLSIVGCAIYRSPNSEGFYYTGFSYDLLVMAHLPPKTVRIPGNAIALQNIFGFIVK